MARRFCSICTLLLFCAVAAQAQPGPPGGTQQTARAAGMALPDGTLPPGTLTARIVRGNFSGNLPGVRVTLEASGGPAKEAMTGADGRAQFAHLTAGATVRVAATVDGERLESEPIVLPAESGVRVLLVAGDRFVDTTKPGEMAQLPPLGEAPPLGSGAAAPEAATTSPPAPAATSGSGTTSTDRAAALRTVMITLTAVALVAVGYGQWRRRRRS